MVMRPSLPVRGNDGLMAPTDFTAQMGAGEPSVVVRSDFRSTAFWQPDVKTGADGKATVKVKYPDSLTRWKATARSVTQGNQFGWASTNTQVKQPLIVRLESPRFFLVGDVLTVSAVVNNNTDKALDVTSKLEADGLVISGIHSGTNGIVKGEQAASVKVQPNGEARIDWAVSVLKSGTARLKVQAKGGQYGDAMMLILSHFTGCTGARMRFTGIFTHHRNGKNMLLSTLRRWNERENWHWRPLPLPNREKCNLSVTTISRASKAMWIV